MKPILTKIILAIAMPGVGWFVLYQFDPKLVDPSSDKSIFGMLRMVNKASQMAGALGGASGKAEGTGELLNIIRQSFDGGDSLFSGDPGERDPMKPLISLTATEFRPARQIEKPVEEARFPISRGSIGGIFFITGAPQVVIEGKRYKIGANVGDAQITAIDRQSVTFQWQGKSYNIDLSKPRTP